MAKKELVKIDKSIVAQNNHVKVIDKKGYYYIERKGINSVSVLPFRMDRSGKVSFLIRQEPHVPLGTMEFTVVNGSFDDKYPEKIVTKEIFEETGYLVSSRDVYFANMVYRCRNTNERVFCYYVDLTGKYKEHDPSGDGSKAEEMAKNFWMSEKEALSKVCDPIFFTIYSYIKAQLDSGKLDEYRKDNDLFISREKLFSSSKIELKDYQLYLLGYIPKSDEVGFIVKYRGEYIVVLANDRNDQLRALDVDISKIII
jgi:hypothetical protein